MAASRAHLIAALQQTHPALLRLTSSLSDRALDFRPAAGDWSIRDILAHLVDDEMYVMRTRLERMIKEDRPSLAPHDEKEWYASRNTTRDRVSELLSDFELQRAASLGIISMLREGIGRAKDTNLNTACLPRRSGSSTGWHMIAPICSRLKAP